MLLFLGLLLLFLPNVTARGKTPLPKRFEFIYMKLIQNETGGTLVWGEMLAIEALDILMKGYSMDFSYDLKLLATQNFSKEDNSTLEQKALYTLENTLQSSQEELRRITPGTLYGCDGIMNSKGKEDVMMILCLFKKSIELPESMRTTFERLNRKYNKYLVWDEEIAREALDESKSPTRGPSTYLKLRARMVFRKDDYRPLREKVRLTFRKCFRTKGYLVSLLRNGTHYGCDGIFETKRDNNHLISVVCLYQKN